MISLRVDSRDTELWALVDTQREAVSRFTTTQRIPNASDYLAFRNIFLACGWTGWGFHWPGSPLFLHNAGETLERIPRFSAIPKRRGLEGLCHVNVEGMGKVIGRTSHVLVWVISLISSRWSDSLWFTEWLFKYQDTFQSRGCGLTLFLVVFHLDVNDWYSRGCPLRDRLNIWPD